MNKNIEISKQLKETLDLTRKLKLMNSGSLELINTSEFDAFENNIREYGYYDPDAVRVLLVGEVKAGKSTLLNAIYRNNNAAADMFEMTSWIARYWHSDDPFCRIELKSGEKVEMEIVEFNNKCQKREFSQQELKSFDRVDFGIKEADSSFVFIDAPGMGGLNDFNEVKLINAISDCDLIMWVMDVDSIGSAKEAALIKKLQNNGLPLISVLTKCDTLESDSDVDEIKEYLSNNFSINPDVVFPTSAINVVKNISDDQIYSGSGVRDLVKYIADTVVPQNKLLKEKAYKAHLNMTYDAALKNINRASGELKKIQNTVHQTKEIFQNMTNAIQGRIEIELESYVKENLLGRQRRDLSRDIEEILKFNKGVISQSELESVFTRNMGKYKMDLFWQSLLEEVEKLIRELWPSKIKDSLPLLKDVVKNIHLTAEKNITLYFNSFDYNIDAIAEQSFSTGLKGTLGFAGALSAYAAWFGPAAAYVTLPMALTGIGIPIAIFGGGISGIVAVYKRHKAQQSLRMKAEAILDEVISKFIENTIRVSFFPKVLELNKNIGNSVLYGLFKQQYPLLPVEEIDSLTNKAADNCVKLEFDKNTISVN